MSTGITPLYDAAMNGHLKTIEVLLDQGASATIKADHGDTPLQVLKEWCQNHNLSGEDQMLYNNLVSRMTEVMENDGQTVLSSISGSQQETIPVPENHSQDKKYLSQFLDQGDDEILVCKFYY